MTLDGITTVARQEVRLRVRAGRWKVLLAVWFAVLLGFSVLLRLALGAGLPADEPRGTAMFGGLMLFVLALALLVVPALAAQSVNGDRERGTLATLQVTRLSAGEIALGKFLAAWGTALLFLALTAPLVLWAVLSGGVPLAQLVVTVLVLAVLLGTVVAVALGLSAVLARSTTSAVLSYLAVFGLTVGTLVSFGLVTAVTTQEVVRTNRVPTGYTPENVPTGFTVESYRSTRLRPDRTWGLLAPNPFVILADAAPAAPPRVVVQPDGTRQEVSSPVDPLGALGHAVGQARLDPDSLAAASGEDGGLVWPTGLAVDLSLGGAALWVTARRLRTPSRHLARGQRVA